METIQISWWFVGLIAGLIAIAYYVNRDNGKTVSPPTPAPTPVPPVVDHRTRLIIDTDMGPDSDPDDVQTWIAQYPAIINVFNVRGAVTTAKPGNRSGAEMLRNLQNELADALPARYGARTNVYAGPAASLFYREEIQNAHANGIPLEIHVWGSLITLADAVQDIPANQLGNVTVYWVASWNRTGHESFRNAYERLNPRVKFFKEWYQDEQGFRGVMRGGDELMLKVLDENIILSPVGKVYAKYPIPPADAQYHNKWKGGDVALYFYSRNKAFRDSVFGMKMGDRYIAQGDYAERMVAANGFRGNMVNHISENVGFSGAK